MSLHNSSNVILHSSADMSPPAICGHGLAHGQVTGSASDFPAQLLITRTSNVAGSDGYQTLIQLHPMPLWLCCRHWIRNQDSEDGPIAVVTDPIYIYRDPSCTNKQASTAPLAARQKSADNSKS